MTQRYSRQIILEEIGEDGQSAINRAKVLVIGAGGLGCPALQYLTAAGVGTIGIADFDIVDESNLQRQVLFSTDQIGQNKALAAKDKLRALNPEITIETYEDGLNDTNAQELFEAYDYIIDGTDNFETKFLINDAGVKFAKPVIYGAINQFEGQISVFDANQGPCYRCLYPSKPENHIPNCAQAGVIGAVAGIIGTAQAMETLKLIINHKNFQPLIGQLLTFDLKTMQTRMLNIPKDQNCPVCAKETHTITLPEITTKATMENCSVIEHLSVEDARKDTSLFYLDVREQDEWDCGHIDGATLLPLSELLQGQKPDLPADQKILIYCRSGKRSFDAARILKMHGYDNVANLEGGILAWHQQA